MEKAVEVFAAVSFLVIGLSHLFQRGAWLEFFAKLHGLGRPGPFAEGFLYLNFGALIISFHNVWSGPEIVLTLIGWIQIAKAFVRFVAPERVLRLYSRMGPDRAWQIQAAGGLFVLLAVFLVLNLTRSFRAGDAFPRTPRPSPEFGATPVEVEPGPGAGEGMMAKPKKPAVNPDEVPGDVRQRVVEDFGAELADEIYRDLLDRIPEGLPNGTRPRHLRCILYLAKGDRSALDHYVQMCLEDTRDVMLRAEYEGGGDAYVRLRDFSKPFDQAELPKRKRPSDR